MIHWPANCPGKNTGSSPPQTLFSRQNTKYALSITSSADKDLNDSGRCPAYLDGPCGSNEVRKVSEIEINNPGRIGVFYFLGE